MIAQLFADFATFTYWHWLIAAGVLLVIEIVTPTFFFLWLAAAAVVMAVIAFFWPGLEWYVQAVIFGILGILSVAARRYRKPSTEPKSLLNRRGEQYVGQAFTLDQSIVDGAGVIKVEDTVWKVEGVDLPAGTRVRVVGVNGSSLVVKEAK